MGMEQHLLSSKFSFGGLSYTEPLMYCTYTVPLMYYKYIVPLMSVALRQCQGLVFTDEKMSFLFLSQPFALEEGFAIPLLSF